VIRFDDVALRYPAGTLALDRLDLDVAGGELVALLGPSGCGKSSALRLAAGLEHPSRGTVTVDVAADAGPQPITFVFQDATLLPWRVVADNVGLPLELCGTPRDERDRRVADALARVGLTGFERHYPRELSGGMRMRTSLARALVGRPKVMLLDEPFAALDEIARQKLQEDLAALHGASGFTALFVTHSVSEAVYLADRVAVFSARPGHLVDVVAVDLPKPRPTEIRTAPAFSAHVARIGAVLREQVA
jgi:NitT/TauT family transport system ATP-binding protein